jgi:hypothetical protein
MQDSSRGGDGQPPGTYAEWNSALADHFFVGARARRTVIFVDDDLLDRMAAAPDQGAARLASFVAPRLRLRTDDYFERFHAEGRDWWIGGCQGWPPFLPLLALTVLAAARMDSDDQLSAGNYYARFRSLLGIDGRGMPPGYDRTIPDLWRRYLQGWMNDRTAGAHGTISFPLQFPGVTTNIGYALSQTILRASDRRRLTQFFRWLGLRSGESVDPAELALHFTLWAERAHLSLGTRELTRQGDSAGYLGDVLADEFSQWDGEERDDAGRRVGQLHLALQLPAGKLSVVPARPRGFPEALNFADAKSSVVFAPLSEDWYQPLATPVTTALLESGVQLRDRSWSFSLPGRKVVPFRQDETFGSWISSDRVVPLEHHCLLVHQTLTAGVSAYLRAVVGDEAASPCRAAAIPAAWSLYRDVVFLERPAVEVPAQLEILRPRPENRVSLWRGLRLPTGHDVFLTGGEPDLWIPEELASRAAVVDGAAVPRAPDQFRIELRALGLDEGLHAVTVGPSRRTFASCRSLRPRQPETAGSISTPLLARHTPGSEYVTPRVSGAQISGAGGSASAPGNRVYLRRGATRYLVLGARPGQIAHPRPTPPPSWLRRVNLQSTANLFDFTAGFEPVWLLWEWATSPGWRVRLANALEPAIADLPSDPAAIREWHAVFDLEPALAADASALWGRYRAAAHSVAGT